MYTTFYGLDELPFELSPNPKYLLLTARHREALANLQYGISARKSLTLLLGEAGTGKTTMVQAALASEACRGARIVHLANPMLTRNEFVELLARAFQLSPEAMGSKATLLAELERELVARTSQGVTTALVIDEAQSLSKDLLEEVRLLSNIETPRQKLLPLVLAAQPELADRLRLPSLVQLKQRVALRCTLGLLDAAETRAYITGRLKVAGANGREIFTPDALQAIYERSGGVPRTISVICDNALVSGFAAEAPVIDADLIREVCDDFDISAPFSAASGAGRPRPAVAEPKAPLAPPLERRETSPLSENVTSSFRAVSLKELRAQPGAPADLPQSPRPATMSHIDWLEGWAPEDPRARPVTPATQATQVLPVALVTLVERLKVSDQLLPAAVAVCAVGLLAVIVGIGWRWSRTPVPLTPVDAVADSQISPPAPPTVAPGLQLTPAASSTAPPEPLVSVQEAPRAVATTSPPATREPAKVRVEPHARVQREAHANRRATSAHAGTAKPKRSVEPASRTPKAALAAVKPFTPQTTVAAPVPTEQPATRPSARATASGPAAAPAAPAVVPPSDEQRILGVLGDYQAAYEQLDPQAVETVWPSVNTRALSRAFDGLSSQSIVFDRCDVSVAAATARAACHGGVEYVKRVGGGGTQSARREWVFDLQKADDGAWQIKSLTSR